MEEDSSVTATYYFRDVEYVVTMNLEGGSTLTVEVEDRLTADQWRGTFDSAYIEDLTHKTGNFKQFTIFVSMLESALTQVSDSVSLDLLTYSDLESLRQRKTGAGPRPQAAGKTTTLGNKRYLILTYTVEFDRIHYPLPLTYQGKPDPRILQESIREMRTEIKNLKQQSLSPGLKNREYEKLREDYEAVLDENENLKAELVEYKRSAAKHGAPKEVKILKTVVKNLEEELMKEKARHQRSANKRNQEYRQLLDEVEELRASERNLKVRVKSLTNELAIYKRSAVSSSQQSQRERESRRSSYLRDRSHSRERTSSRDRPLSSFSRDRSRSRDRFSSQESRRPSLGRTVTPPSAAGTRKPRFDPTAFIKEKERKKKESELKKKRYVRSSLSGSTEKRRTPGYAPSSSEKRGPRPSPSYSLTTSERRKLGPAGRQRTRSRTSSVGSVGSRGSRGSISDVEELPNTSGSRLRNLNRVLKPNRTSSSTAWDSPNVPYQGKTATSKSRLLASTPDSVGTAHRKRVGRGKENYAVEGADSDYFDRSAEMSEIDARLNRLQQLMRSNIPS
ncbi:coiled-coil domain-containing protein 61 isoform X2 [Lingula anatina]|uniref:Centrosomal protein CCDC61 n=1 Tax=Lingula anatina TaxID=7574 RepID=A0A1S3IPD7_LINAN|nr:coiled-coil domain-containing protein 61 isoform X2 [Lingula anatina]|eukprot:XP_013400080.1 coiled-coil domain-containing protein 61 isoform X2 [Lingula anatina]